MIFPDLLFLMETMNPSEVVLQKLNWMGYTSHLLVPPHSPGSGGLALFWKAHLVVEVISSCKNFIDTKIIAKGRSFFSTFLYGEPDHQKRLELWNHLKNYVNDREEPWLISGDFNEIINN